MHGCAEEEGGEKGSEGGRAKKGGKREKRTHTSIRIAMLLVLTIHLLCIYPSLSPFAFSFISVPLEEGVSSFASLKDNDGTSVPDDLSFDPKVDVCALPYSSGVRTCIHTRNSTTPTWHTKFTNPPNPTN